MTNEDVAERASTVWQEGYVFTARAAVMEALSGHKVVPEDAVVLDEAAVADLRADLAGADCGAPESIRAARDRLRALLHEEPPKECGRLMGYACAAPGEVGAPPVYCPVVGDHDTCVAEIRAPRA